MDYNNTNVVGSLPVVNVDDEVDILFGSNNRTANTNRSALNTAATIVPSIG